MAALYTVSAGIKVYCLNLLFDFYPRRQHIIPGWDSVYNAPSPGCSAINMGESKAAPSVRRARGRDPSRGAIRMRNVTVIV